MSCPYLTEVTMSFCAAFPVKKLVPTRHVTECTCESEQFGTCPVFRELLARCGEGARPVSPPSHAAVPKEGEGS